MRSACRKDTADTIGDIKYIKPLICDEGSGGRSPIVDFFASVWAKQPKMDYDIHVIKEGYSVMSRDSRSMVANATSTLIRGTGFNVIVDTLSAWDKDFLVERSKNGPCPFRD